MGLSGFLYVAIVVGWAVYLVPFALKRYDEATRNRSIDRFSSAMRVLGRRDGEDGGVVARSTTVEVAALRTAAPRAATRTAAKVAARRRRRVLLTLLFLTAVTGGAAGLAFVDWWTVAVPGGLVVAWLVACRMQARRERVAYARSREPRAEPAPASRATRARVDVESEAGVRPEMVAPAVDDEPTVVLQRADLDAAEAAYEGQGSLWDPVPVTLPTYVHKPRAPRTIRTIDLGEPGVQSSGHTEEYTEEHAASAPVEEPAAHEADEPSPEPGPTRRAVGE